MPRPGPPRRVHAASPTLAARANASMPGRCARNATVATGRGPCRASNGPRECGAAPTLPVMTRAAMALGIPAPGRRPDGPATGAARCRHAGAPRLGLRSCHLYTNNVSIRHEA